GAEPRIKRKPATKILGVDIGDTPIGCNAPALDGIEVVDRTERAVGAADRDELFQRWLNIAGLISATALQHCRLTVPRPRQAEPHGTDRLGHGFDARRYPGGAPIGRYID